MVVPHIGLRPRSVRSVPRDDPRPRSLPGFAASISRMVLAGVVVGLAIGAMACVAGLAEGSGHGVHAQVLDVRLTPVAPSMEGHVTAVPGVAGEHAVRGSAVPANRNHPDAAGTWTESHPGMACVVTVDLDVDEPVHPVMAGWVDTPRATRLVDCVVDLEPPVPRTS